MPLDEDTSGCLMGLYKIDHDAEERAFFGSHPNYSDVSSDDFSVTYENNSPCTDQGRAKSFVNS